MKILGIEMSTKEFDKLMCEQNKGKELKIIDGRVVAVEHLVTEKEIKQQKIFKLENWFNNFFDKQLIQSSWQNNFIPSYDNYFNCTYDSIEELKAKAEEVRSEIKRLREEI